MGRQAADQGQGVFATLDGLRGYGAILVVIGHTLFFWGNFVEAASPVCVDLFFLLSGFVIAYAYEPRIAAGMGAREFMTHRIVRLYPLYLLGLAIGLLVALVAAIDEPDAARIATGVVGDMALQLVMLPSPDSREGTLIYALNPPAWTLLFELIANLIYILVWRWLSTPVLGVLVAALAVWLGVAAIGHGSLDMGPTWDTFAGGFARGCFGFFSGVLGFRLLGSPRQPGTQRSLWPVYIFVTLTVISILPTSSQLRPYLDMVLVVGLGIPLLVAGQMVEPPRALVPLMVTLGRISYALYILHMPIYEIIKRMVWLSPSILPYKVFVGPVILIVALAAAYAAERWYDRPVRRWIVANLRARARQKDAQRVPDTRLTMAVSWGQQHPGVSAWNGQG